MCHGLVSCIERCVFLSVRRMKWPEIEKYHSKFCADSGRLAEYFYFFFFFCLAFINQTTQKSTYSICRNGFVEGRRYINAANICTLNTRNSIREWISNHAKYFPNQSIGINLDCVFKIRVWPTQQKMNINTMRVQ